MRVYIGADHRGWQLKNKLREWLEKEGYEVVDKGGKVYDKNDDYPDYAVEVVKAVLGDKESRGILLCGSGQGVNITANRFRGIRSILGFNEEVVRQGRQDEDGNVLALAADWLTEEEAKRRVKIFLETPFSGQVRHKRRLEKISGIGEKGA